MYIFVDESGIHKQTDHSTFCLVYITMEHRDDVEQKVIEIEQRHGISVFHWVDQPWKLRKAFIQDVSTLPFTAKIAIFDNPISPGRALAWALTHVIVEKHFKALYIDGKKPRWVERQLKKVLRDKGISVKKLKTVRSNSSPGIRLADALAGVSRSYHDDPEGKAKILWDCVCKKITTQLVGGQAVR